MKHNPILPLAAVCLTATLVSSCASWNMGTALRESATVNTGVDVCHPVEGKVYRVGKGKSATYYMQAPEVEYTPRHRYAFMWGDMAEIKGNIKHREEIIAADIKPTGRLCWVEVRRLHPPISFHFNISEWTFEKKVDALPAGAKLVRTGETFESTPMAADFGTLSTRQTAWSGVKTVLSYPVKYVADPVMCVVSNVGLGAVYTACAVPFVVVAFPVMTCQDFQKSKLCQETEAERSALRETTSEIYAREHGTSFLYKTSYPVSKRDSEGAGGCYSAIELAEVVDKRRPFRLTVDSWLSEEDCERALAELHAQGFHVVAIVKDCKVVLPPAKK